MVEPRAFVSIPKSAFYNYLIKSIYAADLKRDPIIRDGRQIWAPIAAKFEVAEFALSIARESSMLASSSRYDLSDRLVDQSTKSHELNPFM